jgi:hypothetical protein
MEGTICIEKYRRFWDNPRKLQRKKKEIGQVSFTPSGRW